MPCVRHGDEGTLTEPESVGFSTLPPHTRNSPIREPGASVHEKKPKKHPPFFVPNPRWTRRGPPNWVPVRPRSTSGSHLERCPASLGFDASRGKAPRRLRPFRARERAVSARDAAPADSGQRTVRCTEKGGRFGEVEK